MILSLNNAALYLGLAGGALLGRVALQVLPVTQLGWVGACAALLALSVLVLSRRLSTTVSNSRDVLMSNTQEKGSMA